MKNFIPIEEGYYKTIVKALNEPTSSDAANVLLGNLEMLQELCSFTTITKNNGALYDHAKLGVDKTKGCFWIQGEADQEDYFVELFKLVKFDDGWVVERFAITTKFKDTLPALTKALLSGIKPVPEEWVTIKEEPKPTKTQPIKTQNGPKVVRPQNIPQGHHMRR